MALVEDVKNGIVRDITVSQEDIKKQQAERIAKSKKQESANEAKANNN